MINAADDVLAKELIAPDASFRWTLTGSHDGEFLGIKPTRNKIPVCVMNFY